MSITITRRFEWDAGHRILKHESKCAHLHGHRYAAEITIEGSSLDALGRVIDFGDIKDLIGYWIDDNWDHNMILNDQDPLAFADPSIFGERKPYLLPHNPTAEILAKELGKVVEILLLMRYQKQLWLKRVHLFETPNCSATYEP